MNVKLLGLIGLFSASLLVGCGGGDSTDSSNTTNTTNTTTANTAVSHHQGMSCLTCHASDVSASLAGGNTLASGASIYTSLHTENGTTDITSGHSIRLNISNGSSLTFNQGNGTGNVNLITAPSMSFTATVLDASGNDIHTSGTHESTRLNCNSCHSKTGQNGAPGRIVNFKP